MPLKEISLAQVLEKTSGSSYFTAFVQMVGKANELTFYEGIDENYQPLVEEIEQKMRMEISKNYLEFLTITNGGHIAGMKLFSLDDKSNLDSLYHRNFVADVRKKIKLPDNVLIIGEYNGGLICFQSEDDEGSFVLMDVLNKEKLEFAFLEDLITFRLYLRLLEGGKKKIEEKEKLKKAAKKLHEQIVSENKERKKRTEKARKSIARKAANAGLKRKK